jgi:hypothetical protein
MSARYEAYEVGVLIDQDEDIDELLARLEPNEDMGDGTWAILDTHIGQWVQS